MPAKGRPAVAQPAIRQLAPVTSSLAIRQLCEKERRYATMSQRYTDSLREQNRPAWDHAVQHRFVDELLDGSIPDGAMADYLIQDHRFLDAFVTLVGAAMASSDSAQSRLRFGRFAGMVCGEEDTYFLRAFEALGVGEGDRQHRPDTAATAGITSLMREAAASRSYPAVLAVLCVAEWLYQDWAHRSSAELPRHFVHREWITLHNNEEFDRFVTFLREELDRVGPGASSEVEGYFSRAVELELAFFEEIYPGGSIV